MGRFHPADGLKRLKIQKPTGATKNQEKNNQKSVKNDQKSGKTFLFKLGLLRRIGCLSVGRFHRAQGPEGPENQSPTN